MAVTMIGHIANWLVLATVPAANLYPIFYALRSRWWDSDIGRALLVKGISIMILIDLGIYFAVTGTPAPNWLRAVVYGLCFLGINYQFIVLLKRQRKGRIERRALLEEERRLLHDQ